MSKFIGIGVGLLAVASGLYVINYDAPAQPEQASAVGNSPSDAAASPPPQKQPPLPSGKANASAQGSASVSGIATPVAPNTQQMAGSAPLPEPIPRHQSPPPSIELWQVDPDEPETEVDSVPATQVSVSPEVLSSLHVGQQISMPVPGLNRTVTAEVSSTHNQLDNVEVFKGPITDGHEKDNVIITRGKINTHVIVATREGTFSGVLDNQTGQGTLTDEGDINARMRGRDDSVTVPGRKMTPPQTHNTP